MKPMIGNAHAEGRGSSTKPKARGRKPRSSGLRTLVIQERAGSVDVDQLEELLAELVSRQLLHEDSARGKAHSACSLRPPRDVA